MTEDQKDAHRKRLVRAYTQAPFGSRRAFDLLRRLEKLEATKVSNPGALRR